MSEEAFSLSQYSYDLPAGLIAQEPFDPRDNCRLLIVSRKNKLFKEAVFKEMINFLNKGDLIVFNDTRVINARLLARRGQSRLEVLLLKEKGRGVWEVLVRPGKRARPGDTIIFEGGRFSAKVLERTPQGGRVLEFSSPKIESFLETLGKVPLPPYIKKELIDRDAYQTVYAKKKGAIASPTAGLHFTAGLLKKIKEKGVKTAYLTLHCGLATFRPVKQDDIRNHVIGSEWLEVSKLAAETINKAKEEKRKVVAVGTTSLRALESLAFIAKGKRPALKPFSGETSLYILPGYRFKIADALITNFHTPRSTNFILAASFCGNKFLKQCYAYAIGKKFRFYSFGDAMFIQ